LITKKNYACLFSTNELPKCWYSPHAFSLQQFVFLKHRLDLLAWKQSNSPVENAKSSLKHFLGELPEPAEVGAAKRNGPGTWKEFPLYQPC